MYVHTYNYVCESFLFVMCDVRCEMREARSEKREWGEACFRILSLNSVWMDDDVPSELFDQARLRTDTRGRKAVKRSPILFTGNQVVLLLPTLLRTASKILITNYVCTYIHNMYVCIVQSFNYI